MDGSLEVGDSHDLVFILGNWYLEGPSDFIAQSFPSFASFGRCQCHDYDYL